MHRNMIKNIGLMVSGLALGVMVTLGYNYSGDAADAFCQSREAYMEEMRQSITETLRKLDKGENI